VRVQIRQERRGEWTSDHATGSNLAGEEGVRGVINVGKLAAEIIGWCQGDTWEIDVCVSGGLLNRNAVTKERRTAEIDRLGW
jgi:hypothetical protein